MGSAGRRSGSGSIKGGVSSSPMQQSLGRSSSSSSSTLSYARSAGDAHNEGRTVPGVVAAFARVASGGGMVMASPLNRSAAPAEVARARPIIISPPSPSSLPPVRRTPPNLSAGSRASSMPEGRRAQLAQSDALPDAVAVSKPAQKRSVVLVTYGASAHVAAYLSARHPDLVAGIVVMGPVPSFARGRRICGGGSARERLYR